MSEHENASLPNLTLPLSSPASPLSFAGFNLENSPLDYPWKFNTCTEFCQEFNIKNKKLLTAVFDKIKALGTEENHPEAFYRLYAEANLPDFIKKIIIFPEFSTFLKTHNADHCLQLLNKRLSTCVQHKKQLAHIITLFKTDPSEACLALVRFTHSVDTLPEGEEKNQASWLLEQTKQTWYQENYLVRHALNNPFLQDYLKTHPHWTPSVDFILTLIKQHASLSENNWETFLSLAQYNTPIFCELISQSAEMNQLDLALFNELLGSHPENLDLCLKVSQHHPARFNAWAEWASLLPEQAGKMFNYWQNQLGHLTNDSDSLEKALTKLLNKVQNHTLTLTPPNQLAFDKLIQAHLALKKIPLTNREKDRLPETKRYLLTELVLLTTVKATCWTLGASLYMPALIYELYNQKIAPKLGTPLTPETGFDPAFYGMYAAVGKPFSGNRIFEYTGQDSFKQTFLNGFKLFKNSDVGKKYFDHVNRPEITDAEFYERILAKT
jgi:hypothetical protein